MLAEACFHLLESIVVAKACMLWARAGTTLVKHDMSCSSFTDFHSCHPASKRRESMDSNSSMQESRSASFDGAKSVDEARMRMWRDSRAKKMWEQPDPSTAFWSA